MFLMCGTTYTFKKGKEIGDHDDLVQFLCFVCAVLLEKVTPNHPNRFKNRDVSNEHLDPPTKGM